jgi:integrase
MTRVSRGTVNRKVWKYCEAHQTMILKSGPCAEAKCKGKSRERFEFCFTYSGDDGVKRRARGQAPSKGEAETAMEARKAELTREPAPVVVTPITLNEYADKWLTNVASSIERRTLQSYTGMLKNHIRPALGALALPAVTRAQVKDLLASKRASGLAKDSVRLIRSTISAIYADAQDAELVTVNPAAKVGRARGRKSPDSVNATERRQKNKAMTVEQLATFLKVGASNHHGLLYLFLADTGVRPGEAFALRWADLDLPARQVNIERAVERGGRIKATKTGESRLVDLTSRLAAALDRYQTEVEAKALAAGRDVPALVFPSEAGTPLDDINVGRRFREVVLRAGLPKFSL